MKPLDLGPHEDGPASTAGSNGSRLLQLCEDLQGSDELRAAAAARYLLEHRQENSAIAALGLALRRAGPIAREATRSLAAIGTLAVPVLLLCLNDADDGRRWHAAMALTQIAAAESALALVVALTDTDAGVRWEAAKALAAIGGPSLAPLLTALADETLSSWLATGAQRVLLRLEPLFPALHLERLRRMLEQTHERIAVPLEAYRLLQYLPADADLRRPWSAEVRPARPSQPSGV